MKLIYYPLLFSASLAFAQNPNQEIGHDQSESLELQSNQRSTMEWLGALAISFSQTNAQAGKTIFTPIPDSIIFYTSVYSDPSFKALVEKDASGQRIVGARYSEKSIGNIFHDMRIIFDYDQNGNLVEINGGPDIQNFTSGFRYRYKYDANGRVYFFSAEEYVGFWNKISGDSLNFVYNSNNQIQKIEQHKFQGGQQWAIIKMVEIDNEISGQPVDFTVTTNRNNNFKQTKYLNTSWPLGFSGYIEYFFPNMNLANGFSARIHERLVLRQQWPMYQMHELCAEEHENEGTQSNPIWVPKTRKTVTGINKIKIKEENFINNSWEEKGRYEILKVNQKVVEFSFTSAKPTSITKDFIHQYNYNTQGHLIEDLRFEKTQNQQPFTQVRGFKWDINFGHFDEILDYTYFTYNRVSSTWSPGFKYRYTYGENIGNKELDLSLFKAYPNPAGDFVEISMPNRDFEIQLNDAYGNPIQTLRNRDSNTIRVDLSYLPSGMYFIVVARSEGALWQEKIIKE